MRKTAENEALDKKMPGTRPGEVQQGGEDTEREASLPSKQQIGRNICAIKDKGLGIVQSRYDLCAWLTKSWILAHQKQGAFTLGSSTEW